MKLAIVAVAAAFSFNVFAAEPAKAEAPKAEAPKAQAAPAPPQVTETPADKLGTLATGFGLAVGAKAPNATLTDVAGKNQTLADLYKAGPTFVVFYRGGWCPFCNVQLNQLSKAQAEFEKRGVKLAAISVDVPNEGAKTQAKNGVPFAILSDSKLVAHKAFKVMRTPGADEAKALAGYGIDLKAYSGEAHGSFAVPAMFLVDKKGTIRFAHADEDYKTRPSTKQMLEIAEKMAAK